MAVPAAVLSVLVQANTGGATRGLMRFNQQLGGTETKANRATAALTTMAKVGIIGVGAATGYAVSKAADFEEQMDSLGSVTNATGKQMEMFRKQAMKAGADTKFSALDAAEAQTELAKGGLKVRQIMKGGLKSALALAAAGEMELGEAAQTTANALNLFGLEGAKSMKVADALAKAANATTADVSDFAMALRQSGGVAKTAGLSFTETVLALEALANAGTKNSDAGTSLKTALIQLIKPTEKQQALSKKLNLEFLDAEGNFKNLADVSTMLRDRLGGMTAAQRTATLATLAGTDGVRTLTALYDAGPKKLDRWKRGLNESGTAADVAAKKQSNLKGRLENLQGSIETVAIAFGSKLLPGLTKFAEEATKIINDPKLTGGEKFSRFMEMVTQAVNKAIPVVADAGVKIAGALAGGLARGWREMNPLAKLFTAAAVIRLVGGRGALLKSGVAIGTTVGAGVSAGAAGAAGGAGAGAAGGGLIASMTKKVLPVAKRLGLAGVGIALADVVISEFGRRSALKGGDMFAALKAQMGPEVMGLDLFGDTGPGLNLLGDTLLKDSEKAARKLLPALEAIQKAQRGIGHERAEALRKEIGRLDEITPQARQALRELVGGFERTGQKAKALEASIARMKKGSVLSIKELRQVTTGNVKTIADVMGQKSKDGTDAMRRNFKAGVSAVKTLMKSGQITTGEAAKEIRRLLKTHSGAGKDALKLNFKEARDFIARTMTNSKGVTKDGMSAIRGIFAQELKLYGLSKEAIKFRLQGKEGSGKSGKGFTLNQRGGPINQGAPSGDSVPALLERGEYVMNRNAVKKVGRKTLDQINFAAAPRFQKGGVAGMVSAANRVDKAQFPYSWGGGHQATPAPFGPFDCSGAVSYVLQKGGVNVPTSVSGALASMGYPGPGKVTVFANAGHTFMRIGDRYFGTSGSNPGGGAGWFPDPGDAYKSGFTQRHFKASGNVAGTMNMIKPMTVAGGADSPLRAAAQNAVDKTRRAANRRLAALSAPIGAGDAGDPGPVGSWKGGSTRAFAVKLAKKAGIPWNPDTASGYRDPAENARVGGSPTSMHMNGTVANPGAWDVAVNAYGPLSSKGDRLAALGRKANLAEVIWKAPDHYDHVHLGFFQKGGMIQRLMEMVGMQSGGAINTAAEALRAAGFKGSTLIRMIAEAGGESGYNFKAVGDGGASKGMLQIHTGYNPWAAGLDLFDPYVNAKAAKRIYDSQGVGAWHASHEAYMARAKAAYLATKGDGGGGAGGGGGGGGVGNKIKKLAYAGDSLGQGTLAAGLKGKLGKIKLSSWAGKSQTPVAGAGRLESMLLDKGVGAAMLDMGSNGSLGDLNLAIRRVEGALDGRPLMMSTLDPQVLNAGKKNAAIRSNANVVVPWGNVANKFASDRVHPTGAGYSKRAGMIAAAAKGISGEGDGGGLTEREKKQLKTPLKGSLGKVLTKTLKVLRSSKPAKFRGTRLKQLEKRIRGMGVGVPAGIRKDITRLRGNIEEVGEYADRAGALNIDNEDGTTSLGVVKGKTEAGWVTDQLALLLRLRDRLIDAKAALEKHRKTIQDLIVRMHKRLKEIKKHMGHGKESIKRGEKELKQLQRHPQRNRARIKDVKAFLKRMHEGQATRARERDAIQDKILPALGAKRKEFNTYIGEHIMGSDGLPQVQGLGSPLERLKALPAIGVLGGDIFDAQIRLRELSAPVSATDGSSAEPSESAELLKELLRQANLRTAVSEKQFEVFKNFPAYGGEFATGGVVPGPIGAARTIIAHGGETVTPPGNGGGANVQINFGPGMDWLEQFIEVKVDGVTRKQARNANRMLPGRGGGI